VFKLQLLKITSRSRDSQQVNTHQRFFSFVLLIGTIEISTISTQRDVIWCRILRFTREFNIEAITRDISNVMTEKPTPNAKQTGF